MSNNRVVTIRFTTRLQKTFKDALLRIRQCHLIHRQKKGLWLNPHQSENTDLWVISCHYVNDKTGEWWAKLQNALPCPR